jgi:hypothetical protein
VARSRQTLDAIYTHLYSEIDVDYCCYCGDAKECLDHVPALTWVGSLGTEYFKDISVSLTLVPSCAECNALLGSVCIFEMDERKAFISGALKSRYKDILNMPVWGQEINELALDLKRSIQDKQRLQRILILRIKFADACFLEKTGRDVEPGALKTDGSNAPDESDSEHHFYDGVWLHWKEWVDKYLPGVNKQKLQTWVDAGYIKPALNLDRRLEIHEDAVISIPKHEFDLHMENKRKHFRHVQTSS